MAQANRDDNYIPTILGTSSADSSTPVAVEADPTTKRLLVDVDGALGTSSTDDEAFTAGTDDGIPIMGFVTADTVDSGDVGVVGMDTNRNLKISIEADNVGIGGGGTQHNEDDAHTTGDTGTFALGVRNDTLASLVDTDGDYAPLQVNASGALYIQEGSALDVSAATVTVDNGGVFAVQEDGAALTALQLIDDIVKTDDSAFTPASDAVAMVGAEFDDTTPDSVDEGDAGALRMSSRRELYVQLRDAAGNERGLNVDANGAIAITLPNEGQQTSANSISVAIASDQGSIGTVQLEANDGTDIGDVDVASQPARDRTTDNMGVAIQTDALMNDTTALTPKFAIIDAASSGDNTIISAAGAGIKIRVLQYVLVASAAVTVRFEDGAAGAALTGQMQLAANGGVSTAFCPVGLFETSDNTLLNLELSGATSVDGHLTYVEV